MNNDCKTFLVRYRHEGAEWGIQLKARDFEDAQTRLGKLAYGNIDGELITTLPASTGPLVFIAVACRNAVKWLLNPSI